MILSEVFDLFVKQSPVTVMVRATMENVLSAERLDQLFAETAVRQRPSALAFSLVADLMGTVVCGVRPSMHAAFQANSEAIAVTIKPLYDKLRGIEPGVTRTLVRETATRLAEIVDHTEGTLPPWLPGYRVKILDGNHLRRTDRRLKELRSRNAAPLPGHSLVLLDPERMLAIDVFPCEDGHAQERRLLPQVLPTVERGDCLVADRNFCTMDFLAGIADRGGSFIIRQHKQALRGELQGERREAGKIETGSVFEQPLRLLPREKEPWPVRRISVLLDEPTRDGDTELHVLTNLPESIDACRIAEIYRRRWTIETAFQELEATLEGELQTLCYPRAALFAFAMALTAYNVLSTVKAALRGEHGAEKINHEVSGYYLADEVAGTWRGMMIVLPGEFWTEQFADRTPRQMAELLREAAQQIRLPAFRKHPRGPKKKPPSKMNKKHRRHVSTARILEERTSEPTKK
ncbi:Transposase [Planctomycetales bacterium 10988]|nr:Transposase [Planctomycetales bacterium 10988]QGJ69446.1 Transposase [Planctomycetales bacterium 10988]